MFVKNLFLRISDVPATYGMTMLVHLLSVLSSKCLHFFYLDFNSSVIYIPELIAGGQFQGGMRLCFHVFHLDMSHYRRDQ